ncbi:hypothetical protein CPT_Moabite_275 [Serratia phage Moabite]|uniref:Uncharacterized protein n=2 Tax=Moabitevirus moabite TaxID=2846181 RepID=A0A7T3NBX9_9CAUD|nr:hypothetical protein HWC48_gp141 [Serratia phage Moabite]QDB71305.1 hypothetical protein CPT_Moabite_275 [Serratia phage Moabite]QPX76879.1 hypothetical protein [Serratia phage vB_SmaM_Yaphecito]UGO54158.1 hypothetical protein HAYMO_176 [Serratia phage vB_SmaM_Haymo]
MGDFLDFIMGAILCSAAAGELDEEEEELEVGEVEDEDD